MHPRLMRLAELSRSKDDEAVVEGKVWVHGHVKELDMRGIRLYIGCATCGKKADAEKGGEFTCDSHYCKGKERVAAARVTLPFIFMDGPEDADLIAYTDDAQKILGTTAENLYAMSHQERDHFFEGVVQSLVKKEIFVRIMPASGALFRWLLKQVSIDAPEGILVQQTV